MKLKPYINCSVEDLIEDDEFIDLVKRLHGTPKWELFLDDHSSSKQKMIEAKKIIMLFVTNEPVPSYEKKLDVWTSLDRFEKGRSRDNGRTLKIGLSSAAAVLILVALGNLVYLNFNRNDATFLFSSSPDPDHPVLVLPNGNQIDLGENDAKVAVLKGQNAIQVNDDSIIGSSVETPDHARLNEVIVPFARKSSMVLADGTKVWLNAGSRFAFPTKFEGNKREVFLEGEGYFEVTENPDHPFIIHTQDIEVKVLGTIFGLSAYAADDFVETVLLEGRVQMQEKNNLFGEKVIMTPSQKATYNKTRKEIDVIAEAHPEAPVAWVKGWYQFSNESPEKVIKKLERYYNVKFDYYPGALSSSLPISGKLDLKESLDEVMAIVAKVTKLNYEIKEDHVVLSGKQE